MHAIIIKQQTSIGPDEGQMFPALMRALTRRGWEPTLWSTARDARIEPWTRGSSWYIERWPSLWPELSLGEPTLAAVEVEMNHHLDVDRWWPRIQRLAKQGVAPGPSEARRRLLRIAYAVSRHVVSTPGLRRFVAWNPHCPHGGIAAELARAAGLEVTTLERGFLPGTWMVDPGGLMGDGQLAGRSLSSLLDQTGDDVAASIRAGSRRLSRVAWSAFERYPQSTADPLPAGRGPRIAVLGSDDVTTGFYPPSHEDRRRTRPGYRSSFAVASAVAKARPDAIVAFKPHPSMEATGETDDVDAPANLVVVAHDFRSLISWSDACVTAGSTTGFVALALGRPLVVTAREVLTGKGVAHEALTEPALPEALERALCRDAFEAQRRQFAGLVGWLDQHYLFDSTRTESLAARLVDDEPQRGGGPVQRAS